LLGSQTNYTITHFAEHSEQFSHDAINRYLAGDRVSPRLVWQNVHEHIIPSEQAYVVFDDTVLDKQHSKKIELVRRQYSGNAHGIINGIGVVTCVYVNPVVNRFWIIDYRIFDPDGDGKTKLQHVSDMLINLVYHKKISWYAVLMDTWYATQELMRHIERMGKVYYCPLKTNRLVDDSGGIVPYSRVDNLKWNPQEETGGKTVKIRGFPKEHKVKLFRVVLSSRHTEYIVTNDGTQDSTSAVQEVYGWRWKIEQFHREAKQVTGIERCQCRKARIVRNHIGCAILVWVRLKQVTLEMGKTIYQVKTSLLSDYLRQHLKSPATKMVLA
jgi:hypothetical protein